MRTQNIKSIRLQTSFMVCAILTIGISLLIPNGIALAQDDNPPVDPEHPVDQAKRLSWAYQRERTILDRQQQRLENTANVIDRVESLIERAQDQGLDASELQAALDTFQEGVSEALTAHAGAAAILTAHEGFDEEGKVTNVEAAKKTVIEARKKLAETHRILVKAMRNLRLDIRLWMRQQRPNRDEQP